MDPTEMQWACSLRVCCDGEEIAVEVDHREDRQVARLAAA
jgi:hypothetical protein